jgi:hypothetical protein
MGFTIQGSNSSGVEIFSPFQTNPASSTKVSFRGEAASEWRWLFIST